jgi:hypothetical protein
MKSQGKRREPKSERRQPASAQVAHDHAHTSDTVHLAQQIDRIIVSEMMEKLRAHHDVDASIGERKPQGIAADGAIDGLSARARQLLGGIETEGVKLDAAFVRERACVGRYVAQTRADVEQ